MLLHAIGNARIFITYDASVYFVHISQQNSIKRKRFIHLIEVNFNNMRGEVFEINIKNDKLLSS